MILYLSIICLLLLISPIFFPVYFKFSSEKKFFSINWICFFLFVDYTDKSCPGIKLKIPFKEVDVMALIKGKIKKSGRKKKKKKSPDAEKTKVKADNSEAKKEADKKASKIKKETNKEGPQVKEKADKTKKKKPSLGEILEILQSPELKAVLIRVYKLGTDALSSFSLAKLEWKVGLGDFYRQGLVMALIHSLPASKNANISGNFEEENLFLLEARFSIAKMLLVGIIFLVRFPYRKAYQIYKKVT